MVCFAVDKDILHAYETRMMTLFDAESVLKSAAGR
jgi:hypothetical protein